MIPTLIFLTAIVILIPWELLLYEKEGHLVPLVTTGSINLFNVNSPPDITEQDARRIAQENGLDPDIVMRDIAIQTILEDPVAVLGSNIRRTLHLWSVDDHVLKQFRWAVYPPIPYPWLIIWFTVSLISFLAVAFLSGLGFIFQSRPLKNYSNVLLVFIFARMLFPIFLSGGNARLIVVNFALMLPAAGIGFANFENIFRSRKKLVTVALASLLPILILFNLRNGYDDMTGFYAPLVSKIHILSGRPTVVIDRIVFQSSNPETGDPLTIKVLTPEYNINDPGNSEITWQITPEEQWTEFVIYSYDSSRPVELELTSGNSGETVRLQPLNRDAWQNWQPAGLDGLSYQWLAITRTIEIPPSQ